MTARSMIRVTALNTAGGMVQVPDTLLGVMNHLVQVGQEDYAVDVLTWYLRYLENRAAGALETDLNGLTLRWERVQT